MQAHLHVVALGALIGVLTTLGALLAKLDSSFPHMVDGSHEQEATENGDELFEYKQAITTVFWAGETAGRENDNISNEESAWDSTWEDSYGGYDDPDDRCGYFPCEFLPDENPFYVALPYNDLTERGSQKESATKIPWYDNVERGESLLKNRWVEVRSNDAVCYGQWEDVGPGEDDDFDYVFGSSTLPKNTFGKHAGLDVSPALRDCLLLDDTDTTRWKFVEEENVPEGPWLDIISTGSANWQ